MEETPFTTLEVVARFAGVKHHAVQQMCAKYQSDLEEFGLVAFEMRAVKEPGARGTKFEKIWHLNEGQAVLILAYLRNTPQVRAFKKALVKEFQRMKAELTRREVNRAKLLPARRTLTDAVRDCLPETPHKSRWYKIYTDLGLAEKQMIQLSNLIPPYCGRQRPPSAKIIYLQVLSVQDRCRHGRGAHPEGTRSREGRQRRGVSDIGRNGGGGAGVGTNRRAD